MEVSVDVITLTGLAAFFVVSLLVGLRLGWLWFRTRRTPELLICIGILGIGPFGFALSAAALTSAGSDAELARTLWRVALFAMNLGGAATALFNWLVFRRAAGWARGLAYAMALGFAGLSLFDLTQTPFFESGARGLYLEIGSWMRIACLLWGASESIHFYTIMRRRRQIGLADAVLTNRFLLWGLGIGAAGIGSVIGTIGTTLAAPEAAPAWVYRSSSLHGLLSAVTMWLAFLPPRAYCRAITARGNKLHPS